MPELFIKSKISVQNATNGVGHPQQPLVLGSPVIDIGNPASSFEDPKMRLPVSTVGGFIY